MIHTTFPSPGEQQIKAAERYLKRVEYHLSKLEDLQDQYTLHQKLRDGVSPPPHHTTSPHSPNRDQQLHTVMINILVYLGDINVKHIDHQYKSNVLIVVILQKSHIAFVN